MRWAQIYRCMSSVRRRNAQLRKESCTCAAARESYEVSRRGRGTLFYFFLFSFCLRVATGTCESDLDSRIYGYAQGRVSAERISTTASAEGSARIWVERQVLRSSLPAHERKYIFPLIVSQSAPRFFYSYSHRECIYSNMDTFEPPD